MTDTELNELEAKAKAATQGTWMSDYYGVYTQNEISLPRNPEDCKYIAAANPAVVQELISELKQVRKERDWLADTLSFNETCLDPNNIDKCIAEADKNCVDCWLNAAKEATCQK